MLIRIETNAPRLHSLLEWETPEGVRVTSAPPTEYKSIDIDIFVNIDLAIDVYKVSKLVLAAWLVKRLLAQSGSHKLYINREEVAVDQPKIEKELQDAIDHEKTENDQ